MKCNEIVNLTRQGHFFFFLLTSNFSISGTRFKTLRAALLHTKSMGLVPESHTLEANIHISSSPGPTDKHTMFFKHEDLS